MAHLYYFLGLFGECNSFAIESHSAGAFSDFNGDVRPQKTPCVVGDRTVCSDFVCRLGRAKVTFGKNPTHGWN
jgi:hypothetical protein